MTKAKGIHLVIGATGTVGREAARATVAAGGRVRALVRSEASARRLVPGVEAVRGDLRDEGALVRALEGVESVLYVSPHEPDEEALAGSVIQAAERARVRLVFVGVHVDGATSLGRALRRWVFGRMLPHYRAKFRIAERARSCRARPIVLMPTNFFQNDELFRDDIVHGSFPQPFERAVNRVDVRDLGAAAARALLDPTLPSGAYPIIGPASLTGDHCASVWAIELARDVRRERDEQRVQAAIARAVSGKKRDDFIATYGVLRRFALPTDARALARTTALLGRPPTSYEQYVRDTVASWRDAPSGVPVGPLQP